MYQKLVKRDNDIAIPGKILAMQMMRAAKLPQAWLISVWANVKWDEDHVMRTPRRPSTGSATERSISPLRALRAN